jgi:Mg/Co/Ni transporter MgtE
MMQSSNMGDDAQSRESAVATGPFVTTAIDILDILNYFVIPSWIYQL